MLPSNLLESVNYAESIVENSNPKANRYDYDLNICSDPGWANFPTIHDSWRFGVWVHEANRIIKIFNEGVETTMNFASQNSFDEEVRIMSVVYCNKLFSSNKVKAHH